MPTSLPLTASIEDMGNKVNEIIDALPVSFDTSTTGVLKLMLSDGSSIDATISSGGSGTVSAAAQGLTLSGSEVRLGGNITNARTISFSGATAGLEFIGTANGATGFYGLDMGNSSAPSVNIYANDSDYAVKMDVKLQPGTSNSAIILSAGVLDEAPSTELRVNPNQVGVTGNMTVDLGTGADFNVNRVNGTYNQNLSIQGFYSSDQDAQIDAVISIVNDAITLNSSISGTTYAGVKLSLDNGLELKGATYHEGMSFNVNSPSVNYTLGNNGNNGVQISGTSFSGDEHIDVNIRSTDSYGSRFVATTVNDSDQMLGEIKLDKQGTDSSPTIDLLLSTSGLPTARVFMQDSGVQITGNVNISGDLSAGGRTITAPYLVPAIGSLTAGTNTSLIPGRVYIFPNTSAITATLADALTDMYIVYIKNMFASTHTLAFNKYEQATGVTHSFPQGKGGVYAWLGSTYGWSRLADA